MQRDNQTFFVTFSSAHRREIPESARVRVLECYLFGNGKQFSLHAAVVMPDHVHLLLTPLVQGGGETPSLSSILRSIKGVSSRRVNLLWGRKGAFWQGESFDRVLRSHESVSDVTTYIVNNPVRKGLVSAWQDYRWTWVENRP